MKIRQRAQMWLGIILATANAAFAVLRYRETDSLRAIISLLLGVLTGLLIAYAGHKRTRRPS
jgi:hypothetical protein